MAGHDTRPPSDWRSRAWGVLRRVMAVLLVHNNDGVETTFTPILSVGYETTRQAANIIHTILGGGIAVSHRVGPPQTGVQVFLFVPNGTVTLTLDDQTSEHWLLAVSYQEVIV